MWPIRTREAVRVRTGAGGAASTRLPGRLRCQGCAAFSAFAPQEACPLGLPPAPAAEARAPGSDPAAAPLVISVLAREGYRLTRLHGELDLATACEARFMLRAQLALGPRLAVDVAGLAFTDALGIRILGRAADQAAGAGGWVRLIGARPQVRRLLELLGEARLLPIYEDEDAAAKDLAGPRPAAAPTRTAAPTEP